MKLLTRLFGPSTPNSAPHAKERLKLALTYDRNRLEQGAMEQLRGELTRVMAKHLAIDAEDIQINIDHATEFDKLVASVPLRPSRRPQTSAAATVTSSTIVARGTTVARGTAVARGTTVARGSKKSRRRR